MRGKLIVLPTTLISDDYTLPTYALTDSGAAAKAFIDRSWAEAHELPMRPLRRPFEIEVIDGRPSESGKVTHFVECSMRINDHHEKRLRFFVT